MVRMDTVQCIMVIMATEAAEVEDVATEVGIFAVFFL